MINNLEEDLDKFIDKVAPNAFALSYSLIPDELQSRQIVYDSFSILFLENKDRFQSVLKSNEYQFFLENNDWQLGVYKTVYDTGVKRFDHIKETIDFTELAPYTKFYEFLEVSERGIIFLKHKGHFKLSEISYITNIPLLKVISNIYRIRLKLLDF